MKLIIAGGRDFNDKSIADYCIHDVLWRCIMNKMKVTEIVCGGASGADNLGKCYAEKHKIPVKIFNADWDKYGKAAGPIRNEEMAAYANILLVFWDGKSKGTHNMIMEAKAKGLVIYALDYSGNFILKLG